MSKILPQNTSILSGDIIRVIPHIEPWRTAVESLIEAPIQLTIDSYMRQVNLIVVLFPHCDINAKTHIIEQIVLSLFTLGEDKPLNMALTYTNKEQLLMTLLRRIIPFYNVGTMPHMDSLIDMLLNHRQYLADDMYQMFLSLSNLNNHELNLQLWHALLEVLQDIPCADNNDNNSKLQYCKTMTRFIGLFGALFSSIPSEDDKNILWHKLTLALFQPTVDAAMYQTLIKPLNALVPQINRDDTPSSAAQHFALAQLIDRIKTIISPSVHSPRMFTSSSTSTSGKRKQEEPSSEAPEGKRTRSGTRY